tara:strand:+ start:2668 stop:4305 length:1638 start_codon:yes stop_codon:yes gene_type:complete
MYNPLASSSNNLENRLAEESESRHLYNQQQHIRKYAKDKDLKAKLKSFDTGKDEGMGFDSVIGAGGFGHYLYKMANNAKSKVLDKVSNGASLSDAVDGLVEDEKNKITSKYPALMEHYNNMKKGIGKLKTAYQLRQAVKANKRVNFDPDVYLQGRKPKIGANITRTNVTRYSLKNTGENYDNPLARQDEPAPEVESKPKFSDLLDEDESIKTGKELDDSSMGLKNVGKYTYGKGDKIFHPETNIYTHLNTGKKYEEGHNLNPVMQDSENFDEGIGELPRPSVRSVNITTRTKTYKNNSNPESYSTLNNEDERIIPAYNGEQEKIFSQSHGGVYKSNEFPSGEIPDSTHFINKPSAEPQVSSLPAPTPEEPEEPEAEPEEPEAEAPEPEAPKAETTVENIVKPEETEAKSIFSKVGELANTKVAKIAGGAMFVAPAIDDLYNDWEQKGLSGNNWQEKAANVITPISTALDFVPGVGQAIGAVGDLASAGLSIWGDIAEKKQHAIDLKNQIAAPIKKLPQISSTSIGDTGGYATQTAAPVQMSGGSF